MNAHGSQPFRHLRAAFVGVWILFSVLGALYTCRRPWGIDKVMGPFLYFFQTEKFPASVNRDIRIYSWAPSEAEADGSRPFAELIRTASPGYADTKANSLAGSYRDYLTYICNTAAGTPSRFIIRADTYSIDHPGKPLSVGYFACEQGRGLQ